MSRARVPPPILIFFVIDLALGIAYVANYLAGQPFGHLTAFLDLDGEANLPTWYSSIQWFCVAILLGVFAQYNFTLSQGKSWPLLLLPLVFLALSLDEVAHIHEQLGKKVDLLILGGTRTNTPFRWTGIWMFVIGIPFLAALAALLLSLRAYLKDAPGALFKIVLGMAVMLAGAIGIEILSNFVDHQSAYGVAQVFAEESFEMFGATIVLWGSYELVCTEGLSLRIGRIETR